LQYYHHKTIKHYFLSRFGVKVGVASGVVYYTVDEGVWKSSEHTTELYSKIYKNLAPYVKEVPVEVKFTKKKEDAPVIMELGY
jgi:hypothetical protein